MSSEPSCCFVGKTRRVEGAGASLLKNQAALGHRREVISAFAVVAAFGRWACRIAILLGRVSEERITESDVQRLERPTFHDRFG